MSGAIRQVTITGRVQGVGYRAWVDYQARSHDLEGWVRNRRDGSVEALFAGPPDLVSEMVASCWHGPASSRVASVQDEGASPDALNLRLPGERFSVLPTV
jgi:acylphosphatase